MSNVLPKPETGQLTYARPSKIPRYSLVDVQEQTPTLFIETELLLKKEDYKLLVGNVSYDITTLTIGDVANLLIDNGVNVDCIEEVRLLDLPAVLLNDFSTKEYKQAPVTVNPIDLSVYNNIDNKSVVSVESKVVPLYSINKLTKRKAIIEEFNDKLFFKTNLDANFVFYYYVHSTRFIWNSNLKSIITNSKEYVSKNMEVIYENFL